MYHLSFRNGHVVQWFVFHQIKLWELAPEVFEQPQLTGLLPLLPLTKNGQNRDTVDRMINALYQSGQQDLLWLGQAIAGFVFTSAEDKQWLKERFHTMFDILKGSWVYQETIEEGKQEGIRQGKQEGIEQGKQEGIEQEKQRTVLHFVELLFPTLLASAKHVMTHKLSLEQLQTLQDQLYLAKTLEEAKAALQAYDTEP
jgi:predicted transposase YdaD